MEYPSSDITTSPPARPGGPRTTLVVGGAIVALIALAVVVALVVPKGPAVYDPGSPEAAFQAFYRAFEEGEVEDAYLLLSSSVKEQVTLAEYRRLDADQTYQRGQDRRVVLLGSDRTGETRLLRLRVDQFYSGRGLGGDRYSYERTIQLVQEDGAWLIDEPIVGTEPVPYGY